MDTSTYAVEAKVESTHWWFVGRRKLISKIITALNIPHDMPILDVGTGTGTNLRLLKDLRYTNVTGVDINETAIRFCLEKSLGKVKQGDICNLPFENNQFQLILATDIIEHVDNDLMALSEINRILLPGGIAIITVPAFQKLWGLQDKVSHHKRRYKVRQLKALVEKVGLYISKSFYFNYILFIPIWLARQIMHIFRIKLASENQINTPILNRILTHIFTFDVLSARWIRPPFGVSVMVVATKPQINEVDGGIKF